MIQPVTSADPSAGDAVMVTIHNGHTSWVPDSAIVYVGASVPTDNGCCAPTNGTG